MESDDRERPSPENETSNEQTTKIFSSLNPNEQQVEDKMSGRDSRNAEVLDLSVNQKTREEVRDDGKNAEATTDPSATSNVDRRAEEKPNSDPRITMGSGDQSTESNVVSKEVQQSVDDYSFRLMQRLLIDQNGIQERILKLIELLKVEQTGSLPEEYDAMKEIMDAIERNSQLAEGDDGKRLSLRSKEAKSNRNVDLKRLDEEIERQFGLKSVEIAGDGACVFRAAAISGLGVADSSHAEIRKSVIKHVLDHSNYYRTVVKPGEKVNDEELADWAESMLDPNTYGDELSMMAMADRYQMQIVVFRAGELLAVVNPRAGIIQRTAFLVNVGFHYKALVTASEFDKASLNSERLRRKDSDLGSAKTNKNKR